MTSLLAGFIIFGILGHLAHVMGIKDIQQVIKGNVALAFIAYPETIAKIDFMPQVRYLKFMRDLIIIVIF
jgi:solute carrier family 6 amino acid transporter-like protein 5/7/9/14